QGRVVGDAHPCHPETAHLHVTERMIEQRPRGLENTITPTPQTQAELVIHIVDEEGVIEPADGLCCGDVDQVARGHGRANDIPARTCLLTPSVRHGDANAPILVQRCYESYAVALWECSQGLRHL